MPHLSAAVLTGATTRDAAQDQGPARVQSHLRGCTRPRAPRAMRLYATRSVRPTDFAQLSDPCQLAGSRLLRQMDQSTIMTATETDRGSAPHNLHMALLLHRLPRLCPINKCCKT